MRGKEDENIIYIYIYIYIDSIMKPTKYCLKEGGAGRGVMKI
jgi:hypothetical protein